MQIRLLFIFLLSAYILSGCQSQPDFTNGSPQSAIPVIASKPDVKDIIFHVESIGTLQPSSIVEVRPQVNGSLKTVFVHEGDAVSAGTPLFEIDQALYAIRVREAEAQLASDRATFNALQKKLLRYQQLVQKDLLSQTEWEDLEANKEKAEAALVLSEARLAALKLDLNHCMITSPIDGRIGKIGIHPGNYVTSSQAQPLAIISNVNSLIVEFNITEKEFSKLPKGPKGFEVASICASDARKTGDITFIDHTFDQKTGTLLIHGTIDNTDSLFNPGQTIRVYLPIKTKIAAIVIPQKAIRYSQEGPFVYIVEADNTVKKRVLTLGKEQGTDQIIKQGILPTDVIVHDGHLRLSEGCKAEVQ